MKNTNKKIHINTVRAVALACAFTAVASFVGISALASSEIQIAQEHSLNH